MIKVVSYLPESEAAIHRCLHTFTFTGRRLFMSFLNKVASLQSKKRLLKRCLPVSFA